MGHDDPGLLGPDPAAEPLSYPGRPTPWSALLVDQHLRRLHGAATAAPAHLRVGRAEVSLGTVLDELGVASLGDRTPVLAVGSNAAPAQVRRKFLTAEVSTVVPLVRALVSGLHVGHSAHVSRPGYVPAAAAVDPRALRRAAVVVWVDDAQLLALDATEPNYDRRALPADVDVRAEVGSSTSRPRVYASRHGMLGDDTGRWPLADQATIVRRILARSAHVRSVTGSTVEAFVAQCRRSEALRARVRAGLVADNLVVVP